MVLEDEGFSVEAYTDSLLAFSDYKPNNYDLLILDIKMPNMDGFELHRKVKEFDNAVKVCFLTAGEMYYETFREKEHSSLSKDLFIHKQIENEELVKKINIILDTK
jgi:DNA-binding response OmpR family regulator